MADDDFDIDIYGDAADDAVERKDGDGDVALEDNLANGHHDQPHHMGDDQPEMIDAGDADAPDDHAPQQGVKRKEGSDERPIDPGATTALLISELHWWHTDDDIRGWVNQAGCEDELTEITFSEHKVNGKSKGQAYIEFSSQQAATAVKRHIDAVEEQASKKHMVNFSNPNINPFRTLPKDGAPRSDKQSGRGNYQQNAGGNYNNFRGGRGGYNNNRNNAGGGFNRNFAAPMGNMGSGGSGGGFQNNMGGFQGNQFGGGGGYNRGGMMGNMRGGMNNMRGRGGMNNAMMGAMGMPGMPMAAMGGPMGGMGAMNMAQMGMQEGFQGLQPHFNPAFFTQNQGAGDWQNPHGAKRPRGE